MALSSQTADWLPSVADVLTPARGKWRGLACAGLIAALIAGVHVLIYALGGTHLAYVHVGYIPVLLAAAVFAVPGGILAGLALGLVLGPVMPLDVEAGVAQPWESWTLRTAFFVAIGALAGGIVAANHAAIRRQRETAQRDPRTGLPNRTAFIAALDERLVGETGCCLLLEIDDYDDILVMLGPDLAEDLMRHGAARLANALPDDVVLYQVRSARFGVWLPDASVGETVRRGEDLVDRLGAPIALGSVEIRVGAAFGVAPAAGDDGSLLLRQAAAALGQARLRERPYAVHESEDIGKREAAFALVSDFRLAMTTKTELSLHYQPKIDLGDGHCCGAEGLLRWTHPNEGPIAPGRFLPLVERTTLMRPLTRWVVETAVERIARGDLPADFVLAVNVSARDVEDLDFLDFLTAALERHGVSGANLELEVTETAFIREPDQMIAGMRHLRALGVKAAIDDFGSAHASFAYLKHLPVDTVKIDRDFVSSLPNPVDEAVIRATVALARRMGFAVVAEGVERREVGDSLRALGCDMAQGYAYSPPVPEHEFALYLERQNGA